MIRKIVSALLAAAFLFSACTKSSEGLLTEKEEKAAAAYATKVVNGPEEAGRRFRRGSFRFMSGGRNSQDGETVRF